MEGIELITKKYEVLIAIQKANNELNKMPTLEEIKSFYANVDWSYLTYLVSENTITIGTNEQAYKILPKGEDYISNYEESRKSRKINLIAMWAAIGACVIGLLTLLLSLLK